MVYSKTPTVKVLVCLENYILELATYLLVMKYEFLRNQILAE
jgi:hypothetical protein